MSLISQRLKSGLITYKMILLKNKNQKNKHKTVHSTFEVKTAEKNVRHRYRNGHRYSGAFMLNK